MSHTFPVDRNLFDSVMVPNYSPSEVIPVRGQGSRLWDQQGREYIDLAGGIAVNCLGHCHPVIVSTLKEQADKLWHVSNVLTNEPALLLAKELVDNTFADKVFFANSGAEANEAAFKLARRWALEEHGKDKTEIIAFKQGFHGRTFFTVTVGGQEAYSDGFGPKPGDILHAEFNNLASVEALISAKTCAIVVEPIQGEGGVTPADVSFIAGLRTLCDKHNALLIFDEVQTGIGRTGELYAYMSTGVKPDILTSAKGLGAGFPIGAMLTTSSIASHLTVGTHGSTYGGNPLACSVSLATVTTVKEQALLDDVIRKSALLSDGLNSINKKHQVFSEIRGKGLLIGAELLPKYHGQAKDIYAESIAQGLMILVAGANVLRFTPSLVIEDKDIIEALAILDKVVEKVVNS